MMKSDGGPEVILVGHCGPDCMLLRMALGRHAPGARFVPINDESQLGGRLTATAFLVNRRLDGSFTAADGIELIRSLPEELRGRAVLISNLPEAQEQARAAGASPGFGKSELYSDAARASMLRLLGEGAGG